MSSSKHHLLPAVLLAALTLAAALVLAPGADAEKGKSRKNLSVTAISASPAEVVPGGELAVAGSVENLGKRNFAGAERGIYVSLRSTSAEYKAGTVELGAVRAGKSQSFEGSVTVPGAIPAGGASYAVIACVKKRGKIGTLRCKTAGSRVTVAKPPTQEPTPTDPDPTPPGPVFTAGSRSLGDPYFPQIGNGGYDAEHYRIALDYDPATNSFADGTSTTVTITATKNLSEFSLDFQRDLVVSAVTLDGTPAAFEQVDATPEFAPYAPGATQPAKLVVTPASGITSGSTVDVRVSYSGTPLQIEDADESYEGWVRSCRLPGFTAPCDGAYTVNEPIGIQSWYPANNVPSDKATIETITTVPTTHVALGTGELESRVANGDGTWTWDWDEDDQTAPFLATATVGLFDYSNNTSFTEDASGRNIPIYKAIDSSKNATAKNTFTTNTAAIPNVMNYLSDNFGPYPFDSTGAVSDIAPDVGYALENQTKPHYASSFASNGVGFSPSTQVHELSHQWYGDAVSPATWREIWFSEGWATFIENAYDPGPPAVEDTQNLQDFFDDIYSTPDDQSDPDDLWKLPPAELAGPENLFNVFSVYDRPGAMIIGFRFIVGDAAFYDFAEGIQDDYRYGVITEEQFIEAAEEASGFTGADLALLDDYFEQWLHSTTKPTLTAGDF